MKVLLASCAALPKGDGDDDPLFDALVRDGVDVEWEVWGGAAEADVVVVRATWDYTERLDEFLAWCDGVPALANPARVIRWNTDKSYLVELAERGVPVVPTAVVEPGEIPVWPSGEFVVKPTIGAGSRGAGRFTDHIEAFAHLKSLGARALVQPYVSSVDEHGETAMVFFAGEYSHSFHKGPMLVQGLEESESGLYTVERLKGIEPSSRQRRARRPGARRGGRPALPVAQGLPLRAGRRRRRRGRSAAAGARTDRADAGLPLHQRGSGISTECGHQGNSISIRFIPEPC